jgi:hypothetical protein
MTEKLRALATKYRDLADLRARRDAMQAAGRPFSEDELRRRRDAFRALSLSFPGALRELEELPLAALVARASAVAEEAEAMSTGRPLRRHWVVVVLDYHETLTRLLAAKAWLSRRLGRAGALTPAVAAEYPALGPAELEAVRRPPDGRLLALVWAELQRRHQLPRERLEQMIFGVPDE